MNFLYGYNSFIGKRDKNEDSLCIREIVTSKGKISLLAVADGMGGLAKGELASATVIRNLAKWIEDNTEKTVMADDINDEFSYQLGVQIKKINLDLIDYANKNESAKLGTTVTAMVVTETGDLSIVHVGDTRVYRIRDNVTSVLTEDHTFTQREVTAGRMTPEEAKNHKYRNKLYMCVGASRIITPQVVKEKCKSGDVYIICSDGFRHVLSNEQLANIFSTEKCKNEEAITENIKNVMEYNFCHGERDNMSAIVMLIK